MESQNSQDVFFKSSNNINFQINPIEYGIDLTASTKSEIDLSTYNPHEIYRVPLAATSISRGRRPDTNKSVAIKKIYKEYLVTDFLKVQAAQEFPLHCSLKHMNIVKGLKWSENDDEYSLIMEYSNRADYFTETIGTNNTSIEDEMRLRLFTSGILEGLHYLHSKGIVHGDIKLENTLLHKELDNEIGEIVKICDFDLSRLLDQNTGKFYMATPVGSRHYMAPEIKSKSYVNEKIDIWAAGVCLYKMAVAYKPTQINQHTYGKGPIPFRQVDWKKKSPDLQNLILAMLEFDPEKRISAIDALEHPWFQI